MSPPSFGSSGPYRKPRFDAYTVLLILALVALIIGCIVLHLETSGYPEPFKVPQAARSVEPAVQFAWTPPPSMTDPVSWESAETAPACG